MPTQKIDPKVIFASDAPAIDKPPVFSDKTKGWDVSRANDGRPEIKQMNKMQQDTDLKILWLNENAVLPYDPTIDYPDGAVTLKDGSFKQLSSGSWVEFLDDFADKDAVKRGIANRYDSSLTYNMGERVILTNGGIVKSTIDGNTNNPNVDMTGWEYSSLTPSNNLSDVADEAEARTNLGVYSKAETDDIAGTPNATETTAGKAKIATAATAQAGVDDTDFLTAKKLRDAVDSPLLGLNQTWTDVRSQRVAGTSYRNTTDRYKFVLMFGAVETFFQISADGVNWFNCFSTGRATFISDGAMVLIPKQWFYRIAVLPQTWLETSDV